MKPRLLDLFCCAGGAGEGYRRAGFDVTGVDIAPQPRYPFAFHLGDALAFLRERWRDFGAIRAERPGLPTVIENVHGAPLDGAVRLCGSSFGLDVRRHRYFEASFPLEGPPCDHGWQTPRFKQATNRANLRRTVEVGVYRIPLAVQRAAMGIGWMELRELSEAIPPAYTEHVGRAMLRAIGSPENKSTHTATPTAPEQTVYMITRAALDAAHAEVARLAPVPGEGADEAAVDAWLDASEAARAALGVDDLIDALDAAEERLLAWSFAIARREAGRSRAKLALIAEVERGIRGVRRSTTRAKVIDLALRLSA